jgi:esterase/lipase superfamily enzyme
LNSPCRAAAAVLLAAHLVLATSGCHLLAPLAAISAPASLHYDTAFEARLAEGETVDLTDAAWRPYVETLDEPVAIVNWRDGVSTWEVFFATNRGRVASTAGTGREQFGNEVLSTPQYGRAEVTLPRRKRGVEPKPASIAGLRLFAADRSDSGENERVEFESVGSTPRDTFLAGVNRQVLQSRQRDLLVFVHGFNVDFRSALVRTAQLALELPFNGAVVAYCWPSQGGVLNYEDDGPVNEQSVAPFAEFLNQLIAAVPGQTRINLVVHSMGSRIVMQALDRMPSPAARKPLSNVVLCAPDIGLSDFAQWAPGVVEQSERVTLYANNDDTALTAAMKVHLERRAGDANPPVVVPGIETVDCSRVDFSFLGHDYYSSADVLADVFAVIKERKSAEQRPYLSRRKLPDGAQYWEFTGSAPQILWTWHFDEPAGAP